MINRSPLVRSQIQEYGLPVDFETGNGYEIDALNAFNPEKFRKLLLNNITPYFNRDIHNQLLKLNPVRVIDSLVRQKVKFLSKHSSIPGPRGGVDRE